MGVDQSHLLFAALTASPASLEHPLGAAMLVALADRHRWVSNFHGVNLSCEVGISSGNQTLTRCAFLVTYLVKLPRTGLLDRITSVYAIIGHLRIKSACKQLVFVDSFLGAL